MTFNDDYPTTVIYSGTALEDPTAEQMSIEGAVYGDVDFTWSASPIGAGTYTLTATIDVTISPKEVTATVELSRTSFKYTGSEIKPDVTVWDGDTEIDSSWVKSQTQTKLGAFWSNL